MILNDLGNIDHVNKNHIAMMEAQNAVLKILVFFQVNYIKTSSSTIVFRQVA